MIVLIIMYTEDTFGIASNNEEISNPLKEAWIFQNPANAKATLVIPPDTGQMEVHLFDMLGREVMYVEDITEKVLEIDKGALHSGMYVYRIEEGSGGFKTGKLIFE